MEVDAYLDAASVRIEVTDEGGASVPYYRDDPQGEHGRGLPILAMLTKSWGFEYLDDGRLRVWFEVPHTAVLNRANGVGVQEPEGVPTLPRPDGTRDEPSAPSASTAHPVDH